MNYYFVTYGAVNSEGNYTYWNDVIKSTLMDFIKKVEKAEIESENPYYYGFVITNATPITEEDYNKWKGQF